MERLKQAIGTPPGMTFFTNAGQAGLSGVQTVFSTCEHRECMYHLVTTRRGTVGRFFMTTYGQQLIHGHLTGLRSTGKQWPRLNQEILGTCKRITRNYGLGVSSILCVRLTMSLTT